MRAPLRRSQEISRDLQDSQERRLPIRTKYDLVFLGVYQSSERTPYTGREIDIPVQRELVSMNRKIQVIGRSRLWRAAMVAPLGFGPVCHVQHPSVHGEDSRESHM